MRTEEAKKVGATKSQPNYRFGIFSRCIGFSVAPDRLCFWRIVLEHLLHAFVQVLDVLIRLAGNCAAGRSSPQQFFRCGVEDVHDERTDLIGLSCGSRISESAAPAPTTPKSVVKGV